LGRLFGYGSIVRSGRVSGQWAHEEGSPIVKDFVDEVIKLGSKKRYLTEPAVAVILDLAGKVRASGTYCTFYDYAFYACNLIRDIKI
jgi:DNA polymerase phi